MAFAIHKYVAMVTQGQINFQILLEQSCFNKVRLCLGDKRNSTTFSGQSWDSGSKRGGEVEQPPLLSQMTFLVTLGFLSQSFL